LWREGAIVVASAIEILRNEESSSGLPLPHSWDATSDSIAAWIAVRWQADELVLVKSAAFPPGNDPALLGLVDRHFRQLALHVPRLGWVNARDASTGIQPWRL
jgi:hypothetical protein